MIAESDVPSHTLQVDEEETVGEGDLLGGVVVFLEVGEELAAFVNALKSRGGWKFENIWRKIQTNFKLHCIHPPWTT